MTIGLLAILFCFALMDIHSQKIRNIAVIPAIVAGIYLTGNWLWALIMFLISAVDFKFQLTIGGDVKLITMLGAFLGFLAIPSLFLAMVFVRWYRRITHKDYENLPYAPFIFLGTLITIGNTWLLSFRQ